MTRSCHTTASGYVGPWSPTPTVFNNLYFVLLKGLTWTPNEKTQKFQYKGDQQLDLGPMIPRLSCDASVCPFARTVFGGHYQLSAEHPSLAPPAF